MRTPQHVARYLLFLFLSAYLTIASGCVNLNDVAKLTQLANAAQQTLPSVVTDIAGSCSRQNVLLRDTPSDERPHDLRPLDCQPYQHLTNHILNDQSVLITYFRAPGRLSSNAPLSYDQKINANMGEIAGMAYLNSDAKGQTMPHRNWRNC